MAQPSKILYLVTQSEWGGAGRYAFDLANEFKSRGYQVAIAAGGNEELFKKSRQNSILVYQLKSLVRAINLFKDIAAYFEIKKILKEFQPDILHLNSSKAGVLGAIAGRQAGVKKIIYTVHGFVFNEPMPKPKKLFYLWAEKFSAQYKDKLLCVSDFDRQTGLKYKIAQADKLITINNGIQPLSFLEAEAAKTELNLPKDKIIIGTVANLYPTKGLDYLISAAKIVTEKFPDAIFRIIGFGQLEKELNEKISKLNLKNNFFIEKKDDAYRFLKAFDIFVLPSVKEGFPFAVLEAMQAELPIIATKVGGIPEIIKDKTNGWLVSPADSKALAEAIINLLQNKNLAAQLGRQAKVDVNNRFSLTKMISETEKAYQN